MVQLELQLFHLHAAIDTGLDPDARLRILNRSTPLMYVFPVTAQVVSKVSARASLSIAAVGFDTGALLQILQLGLELGLAPSLLVALASFKLGIQDLGRAPFLRGERIFFDLVAQVEHHVVPR